MASFTIAQTLVKRAEGGYSNDARDPGNYTGGSIGSGTLIGTNWGISAPVLKAYLGYSPSVSEMENLPYSTAEKIYKAQYWNAIKGDTIQNQKLANMLYDTAVNMGVGRAYEFVKKSLNIPSYDISKVNGANATRLFNDIGKLREAFYIQRGGYALNSWLNRLKDLGYGGISAVGGKRNAALLFIFAVGTLVAGYVLFNKTK